MQNSRQKQNRSGFPLEKTTPNFVSPAVLRVLLNFLPRPPARTSLRRASSARFARPQFASFMAENNRRRHHPDFHDAVLRSRKFMKNVLRLGLFGGCAWVVLESAQALSIF